jgi:hypothetical protein
MRPVGRTDNLTTLLCRMPTNSGSPNNPEPKGGFPGHYFPVVCTNTGRDFEYCRLILLILILELASWNRFCTQIFEVSTISFTLLQPCLTQPGTAMFKMIYAFVNRTYFF